MLYLCWHAERRNLLTMQENGRVIGAAIGRAMNDIGEYRDRWFFNDEGKLLYVVHCAVRKKGILKDLIHSIPGRWPNVKQIAFSRSKNGRLNKFYDFQRFMKLSQGGLCGR